MSIIKNKEELATSELRRQALEILEAGLSAIDTEKVLRKKVLVKDGILSIEGGNDLDLKSFNRVFFIGIGKCALEGARVIEEIFGGFLTEGAVLDVKSAAEAENLKKFKYFQGTHPYPSLQNVEATKKILEMVKEVNQKDLIITLISGGGSALFELPAEGFTLEDIINKTKELTARGADIYELNAARKEMSQVKGGKFAKLVEPAKLISLIFSDVLGNDISVIASGPTVSGEAKNILLVSNVDALEAMQEKAEELGFETTIETDRFSGNAIEKGKELAMRDLPTQTGIKTKSCILLGGETTVLIKDSDGIGGRNQTMALSALSHMQKDAVLICSASDGWDNTDHAGALVDTELLEKAKKMNLNIEEFLERNDSYNFFKKIEDGALCTGRLGSNVADLCILIYK
jgi:glycerate 2-kinase